MRGLLRNFSFQDNYVPGNFTVNKIKDQALGVCKIGQHIQNLPCHGMVSVSLICGQLCHLFCVVSMMLLSARALHLIDLRVLLPVFIMTTHPLSVWAIEQIDKIRRTWLWAGSLDCSPGQCKVAWTSVYRPLKMGGMGVSTYANSMPLFACAGSSLLRPRLT
jgi:hypothetical protein